MISQRVVKHPQKQYRCGHCEGIVSGPHLYVFGGEQFGRPRGMRICAGCALSVGIISEVREFADKNLRPILEKTP